MSLKKTVAKTAKIQAGGTEVEVRPINFFDIQKIFLRYEADLGDVFALISPNGKEVDVSEILDDLYPALRASIIIIPSSVLDLVIMLCGEDDEDVEARAGAMRLSIEDQFAIIAAGVSLTLSSEGALGKLLPAVRGLVLAGAARAAKRRSEEEEEGQGFRVSRTGSTK